MTVLRRLLPDTKLPDFHSKEVFKAVWQATSGQSPEVQQLSV